MKSRMKEKQFDKKMGNLTEEKKVKGVAKRLVATVLTFVMALSLAACGNSAVKDNGTSGADKNNTQESSTEYVAKDIKVAALKGPTAIGMVKLMDEAKNGKSANNYEFKVAAAADEFTSSLIKGDIQIAAMPCNAAATLYNKSNGKIKVVGINTLGVLYILDTGSTVKSVSDLKGKTVYLTGKGTTPEYTLRYLLKKAGLDPDKDVKLEFKSEAAEVAAIMAKGENVVSMLPQPYVTTVMMNNSKARIALDVTKEWEKLAGADSTVVTGVIVVNADYYNNNKAAVDKFMEEYKASVEYVVGNVDDAANLVEKFDIFKAAVAKKAIPYCNISYITGSNMKIKVENYLKVLYDENPAAVGGKMPDNSFYGL